MSRHRSSHTTDTNPGSVPLVPDCHKSDKAGRTEGEGQTEKSKCHSHKALIGQQGGNKQQPLNRGSIYNNTRQAQNTLWKSWKE